MKMFNKIALAGEDVQTYTRSGRFYGADGNPAEIFDGAVVAVGGPVDHEVYDNTKDLNVSKLTAPATVKDIVGIVDYVGINKADVMGVTYYVGDSQRLVA